MKKRSNEEYVERNQKIEGLGEQALARQKRQEQLLLIVERFIVLKWIRIQSRKVLDAWKDVHKERHHIKGLEVYSDNFSKRRLMQKCFLMWRKDTHLTRKKIIEQEYTFKLEKLKTGKLAEHDKRIREMLTRIEAGKRILAEEIAVKEKLTLEYEQALGRGVDALSRETQVISANPIVAGMNKRE